MRKYNRTNRTYGRYYNLILLISALFLFGCVKEIGATTGEIVGYDDFDRKIVLPKAPQRIVMVSATHIETIFKLGKGKKIVGVPDSVKKGSYPDLVKRYPSLLKKPTVGDFSNPSLEKIVSLSPDLIIIYDSADTPGKYSTIFEKWRLNYAAFRTASDVAWGLKQIERLGILLGKEKEAKRLIQGIKEEIEGLSKKADSLKNRPLVYYRWGFGNGTYGKRAVLDELIRLAGGINLAGEFDKQWFELSPEYVISKDPDVIVISYYKEEDREAVIKALKDSPAFAKVKAVKNNRVYAINGTWLHSPILFPKAIRKLTGFIHPEVEINEE